ncbi:MAG: hypothetical protein ACYTGX_16050 [Planctomycetota bacterium]
MQRGTLILTAAACLGGLALTGGCHRHLHAVHRSHRATHAAHLFWFYPAIHVYWSPVHKVYWYRDGGRWVRVHRLPTHIHIDASHYVELESDHQDPHRDYDAHVRRHPPGQYKRDRAPGRAGTAPGRAGTSPGRSGTAPGRSGEAPGRSGEAPGRSGEAPGRSGEAPGHNKGGANPGKGKGHGGGNPGGGRGKGKKK